MTRAQYLLRCRLRRELREAKRRARVLERLNDDPDEQHNWDDWIRAEENVTGVAYALAIFDACLRAGNRPKV